MGRLEWESNLDRLCESMGSYCRANLGTDAGPPSAKSLRLSQSLFLAHSTSTANFSAICESGHLASAQRIAKEGGAPLAARKTEVVLGTSDYVFFYVAPFRYPNTACGLLFAGSLESAYRDTGIATPFDSGGLVSVFGRLYPSETPVAFLLRHELPIPQHRTYLALSMDITFAQPED